MKGSECAYRVIRALMTQQKLVMDVSGIQFFFSKVSHIYLSLQ